MSVKSLTTRHARAAPRPASGARQPRKPLCSPHVCGREVRGHWEFSVQGALRYLLPGRDHLAASLLFCGRGVSCACRVTALPVSVFPTKSPGNEQGPRTAAVSGQGRAGGRRARAGAPAAGRRALRGKPCGCRATSEPGGQAGSGGGDAAKGPRTDHQASRWWLDRPPGTRRLREHGVGAAATGRTSLV